VLTRNPPRRRRLSQRRRAGNRNDFLSIKLNRVFLFCWQNACRHCVQQTAIVDPENDLQAQNDAPVDDRAASVRHLGTGEI
jgi:hypothetical protein